MAPRGNLNFFVCTYNQKISYKQLFVTSFATYLWLSDMFLSDSSASLFHLFHLFWRVNQMTENRQRFVFRVLRFVFCVEGRTLAVFYGAFL